MDKSKSGAWAMRSVIDFFSKDCVPLSDVRKPRQGAVCVRVDHCVEDLRIHDV
jgi:hypothetical protein